MGDPDIEDAKQQALRRFLSPDLAYRNYKAGTTEAAKRYLTTAGKDFDAEDVADIARFLDEYKSGHPSSAFNDVLEELKTQGGSDAYVAKLRALWSGLPNKPPNVLFGPAVTTGFYDTDRHTITLDPVKNPSPDKLLDTLLFECQNALQRGPLKGAVKSGVGRRVAEIEYESDRGYVNALMGVHGVRDFNALVRALSIDTKYLVSADLTAAKAAGKVERPGRTELPDQDKRQALWWWKTKDWSDLDRKEVWIAENHGEGTGSSEEIYSHQRGGNLDAIRFTIAQSSTTPIEFWAILSPARK